MHRAVGIGGSPHMRHQAWELQMDCCYLAGYVFFSWYMLRYG